MKNKFSLILLLLVVAFDVSQAQLAKDSWALGFGGAYPRFVSVNLQPLNSNYGFYISLQRNFSENVGIRLNADYSHLEGEWTNQSLAMITESTDLITGNLDVLYYFVPCSSVSPYLFAGLGGGLRTLNNYASTSLDENGSAFALNVGGGIEVALGADWKLMGEYSYHSMFNSELDGAVATQETNGTDAYMALKLGLLYYFGKGEPSKMCEPCPQGVTMEMRDMTDYGKIDRMIIEHIPKVIEKEVIVDRYIKEISNDRLVLIGVNFDFDKSNLLPESYPVLDKAVELLKNKPNVNVEIAGYTDYIGTDAYNQDLSEARAQTVKNYLVSKGINANRLTTVGYGKGNPVADNDTEEGRAMNRRIVFRIIK